MIAVAKNDLGPRKTKTRDKIKKIGNPDGILNEVIAVRMLTDNVEAVGLPVKSSIEQRLDVILILGRVGVEGDRGDDGTTASNLLADLKHGTFGF